MRSLASPLLVALLAAPVALTGCSKETRSITGVEDATARVSVPSGSESDYGWRRGRDPRVLFVHASPDAPAVDIRVGSKKVAKWLAFPNNTRYLALDSGTRRVRVNVAGTKTTVIDARVKLQSRKNYSVFAVNGVANLEPLVLVDDLTAPAKGMAHVRFVHLSPDAPAVDVALQGGAVVFGNQSFKDYTPFTPLPAGTYDLEVRPAGATAVVLPLPGVTLDAGKIYTVFAKGFLSGKGEQALGAGVIVNNESSRKKDRDDRDEKDAVADLVENE